MNEDADLLQRYAREHDQAAFTELVQRHVDVVYAAAVRQCHHNTAHAEDVTQRVFIELALHAGRLSRHPALLGWLHTTTRFTAMKILRDEARRQQRERESAALDAAEGEDIPVNWERVQPLLDDALARLKDRERAALLLRYFEGRTLKEVGGCLSLTETAARSCVDRALHRLRDQLAKRGVASTTAALSATLAQQTGMAAPAALAVSVAAAAVTASPGSGLIAMLVMKKLIIGIAALLAATELATATVEWRSRSALAADLETVHREYAAATQATRQAATSVAPAPTATPVATQAANAAELARLQKRIAQLKARPPGVIDSAMLAPANRGFATPEDVASTIAWAEQNGDIDFLASHLVLANDTPENRAAFMSAFSPAVRARYPTPEKLLVATHMADSLRDPVAAMQITSTLDDYQGMTIVKGWDRRASGREREDFVPLTQTPKGWAMGPIPLTQEVAQQTLSMVNQKTGEIVVVPPTPVSP